MSTTKPEVDPFEAAVRLHRASCWLTELSDQAETIRDEMDTVMRKLGGNPQNDDDAEAFYDPVFAEAERRDAQDARKARRGR